MVDVVVLPRLGLDLGSVPPHDPLLTNEEKGADDEADEEDRKEGKEDISILGRLYR